MKKINLKRAIQLPNAQKTILRPGIHNIQDDVFSHWFIQGLITKGEIVVMGDFVKPNVLQSVSKPVAESIKPQPVLQKVGPAVSSPPQVEVEEILPKSKQVELDFEPAPPERVEEPVVTEEVVVTEEAPVVEKVEEPVVTEEVVEKPKKIVRRKKKN